MKPVPAADGVSADPLELILVAPEFLPAAWPKIKPLLDATTETWELYASEEDIATLIINGQFKLWMVMRRYDLVLAVLTQLISYPKIVEQRIFWCAGKEIDEALGLLELIEKYGRKHGAILSGVSGRDGWTKKLQSRGYRKAGVLLIKDLSGHTEH